MASACAYRIKGCDMEQTVLGTIMVSVGIVSVVFRRRLASFHADIQKETVNIHLTEDQNKKHERTIIFCGLILLFWGVLTLLGITKWHG